MRRPPSTAAAFAAVAVLAVLLAPAAAQAARYTVKARGGPCGGTDTVCGSLGAAAKAMGAGDALTISPGRYAESPRFAAGGIVVRGSKQAPGVVVEGTLTFAGAAGTSRLERLVVRASGGDATAVAVSGTAGLAVRDASLFSAAGDALTITGSTANSVTRTRLLAGRAAVAIGGGALALDSSILSGGAGAQGAGVAVPTAPAYAPFPAAAVVARHVTIAGAPAAFAFAGSAAATVADSIVLGTAPGAVAFTRTDRASAPAALFVNPQTRNFRLRRGSPAIDRGQITSGDSPTDIDGQPRTLGAASDLGADELDLVAPRITLTRPRARQRVPARSRLRLTGRAQDDSGVAAVVFSLQALPATGRTCRWFDPVRGVVTRRCADPLLVRAKLTGRGRWAYSAPRRLRLPAGRYRVSVSGRDRADNTGNSAPASRRRVTFTVRDRAAAP